MTEVQSYSWQCCVELDEAVKPSRTDEEVLDEIGDVLYNEHRRHKQAQTIVPIDLIMNTLKEVHFGAPCTTEGKKLRQTTLCILRGQQTD